MPKAHGHRSNSILTATLLCTGSVLHREAKNTNGSCEPRNMECSRWCSTDGTFQVLAICAQTHLYCLQGVEKKHYRIILTSPEMCLGDSGFAALLKEPRWSRDILLMVIDEAHCIRHWGAEFRKHYSSLKTLRSFVPRGVPVLATSATLPPDTLSTSDQSKLGISAEKSFHLNLGNDRRKIIPLVWPMEGAASNLEALDFIIRGRNQPLRTIIYFNDKRSTMRACNHLRALLPASQAHIVDVLHASRGSRAKKDVMERFRSGEILILCATEVVGMVRDAILSLPNNPTTRYFRGQIFQMLMTLFNL